MLFADILFLFVFLPLCLISYFVCKDIKAKNAVLLVFSLIFYAWGEPVRILLLVLSAAINYAFAIMIELSKGTRKAKSYLVMSLIYNIGMLAIFKYTDFFLQNVNALLGTSIPMQTIALPLGISFYTFQIISYVIDVYWDKVSAQRKFSDLLMYISLFPQLVAGPIVRYETVAREIRSRKTTIADFSEGACRLIVGLTKKVLLANNLNLLVELMFGVHKTSAGTVINIGNSTVLGAWIGVIAYAMQVYFDFSGYSDMAIGMGRIFGFHFDENFNYPFICRSISEFWQRWHISLGSFFRDYLFYVPIFGKRRKYLSLLLVWFTTGLWHGASWSFVLWGLYFGFFIFIESLAGKKLLKRIPDVIMHIYNKIVIVLGFGIFYFTDMSQMGTFFKALVGANGNAFSSETTVADFESYIWLFLLAIVACFPIVPAIEKRIKSLSYYGQGVAVLIKTVLCCGMLYICVNLLVDSFLTNNPFLYFRF